MESDISQAFQEELTCIIWLSCLTDPVTISCGHSFCRACLHLSLEDIQLSAHCPMCREPSQQKVLRTNIVLKKMVSIARQASLMKDLSSEEHKCVTHKDTKRIFCAEKRIFFCQLCSKSHEHRGHRHCPTEAVVEDQMERLLKQMASLWEKIQENQEKIEAENRMRTLWMDYLTLWEEMIRTEYRKLHPLLCEEEEKHIECMRTEGQCVLEKLRTSEAMMVQKSKQLRELYEELMAMSQEPYVVLLQGVDDMFRRDCNQGSTFIVGIVWLLSLWLVKLNQERKQGSTETPLRDLDQKQARVSPPASPILEVELGAGEVTLQGAVGPKLPLEGGHGWAGSCPTDGGDSMVSWTAAIAQEAFHPKASSLDSAVPIAPPPRQACSSLGPVTNEGQACHL